MYDTKWYAGVVDVVIHQRAYKHGLSQEQILYAFASRFVVSAGRKRDEGSYPPRFAALGFDQMGREIEFVFVRTLEGKILIFHANYATRQFKQELKGVKGTWS